MKYLKTDEQTIGDLAIFDKPGKASIYDLYNKTRTHGGALRMAVIFKEPLAEEGEINARAELYRFFSQQKYTYPIDPVAVGSVAYYLENEDVRSQLQPEGQSFSQRIKQMVATDADHVFVQDGVQATIRLLQQLGEFVKELKNTIPGSPYEKEYNQLAGLLNDSALAELKQYISEKHEVRLNAYLLAELDKMIRFDHRELMLQLLDLLYDLDVYIAVGQVARKNNFHFAKALKESSNALQFKQVYHPYVEGAIANDLRLNKVNNILFLTGANMAGKSTLMKAIGIALYLAHMGFPVAAEGLEFAVRDGIYSNINLADNLSAGASHFYAEVLRVKEVAVELSLGKKLFVIFDELFRGTNVKDAYDATIVLTRAFTYKSGSQFIISTHIMEAGELLAEEPLSIQYQFLPTEMKGNMPVYTRVLRNGITADRQGMVIIENEGILELLEKGIKTNKEELCHS